MVAVRNKQDMYALLAVGAFGNTIPQYFSVWDWLSSIEMGVHPKRLKQWGVRSLTASDPRAKLNVPQEEVKWYVEKHFPNGGYNISPMVWQVGTSLFEGDVYDCPARGLIVSGTIATTDKPIVPGSWRTHMKTPRLWEGMAAREFLRQYLNGNSYDDLMILVEKYPEHVYEMTVLDVCYGTVPWRNAILWEVRKY